MEEHKNIIHIEPISRIEGHLKAEVRIEDNTVVDAHLTGGNFRGFEEILKGRDPMDAPQITQRICGVCPASHALASSTAIEKLSGVFPPTNGRVTRNLIQGANFVQSHILHFYHLAGQDFIQGPDTPPFTPRFDYADLRLSKEENQIGVDQYLEALKVRRVCHEMVALFAGRMPHLHGIIPGGVTQIPTEEKITEYIARFKGVKDFVDNRYVPLVYTVAKVYKNLTQIGRGPKNCLCFGVFPTNDELTEFYFKPGAFYKGAFHAFNPDLITEDNKHSYFKDINSGSNYRETITQPDVDKPGAYSFVKAPRYDGLPMEVGPISRMWISNATLSPAGQKLAKDFFNINATNFRDLGEDLVFSIMGRHIARCEETRHICDVIETNLKLLKPNENTYNKVTIPQTGSATGYTEAPRGALLHYINVENALIKDYQLMPATIWNCSPRDDNDVPGPIEQAAVGIELVENSPVNVARLIRSVDP